MRRALLAVAIAGLVATPAAHAQRTDDAGSLRRALHFDPFAVAPYRLLAGGLRPAERRKLIDELGHDATFSEQVLIARLELDGGQLPAARAALHAAAASLPNDARILDAFCQLALTMGAFPEAALGAQRSLERGRTPPRLVTAAIAELRQGRHQEGLALLAEARGKDPSGGATDAALDTLLGQHLATEAAALLHAELDDRGGAASVGSASQWRRLADLERNLGHFDEASKALLRALDEESSSTGRRATSQSILRIYRDKRALPELARQLKGAHGVPRLLLLGDVQTELGQVAAAKASWEAAGKLDAHDADPQLRLAAAAKTPAERATRYEALVAAHPTELRFALELADLRFSAKDETGGRRALREAGERFSSSPTAQEQIARRLGDHRDLDGAVQARHRAAELDPRNPDYAFALGDAYRALKQRPQATAAYLDVITRAGGVRAAYDRAIEGLEHAGYDTEADALYVDACAKWPGDIGLLRRHAAALERHGDFERARTAWKELQAKATRPLEQEQAAYNIRRLDDAIMERR